MVMERRSAEAAARAKRAAAQREAEMLNRVRAARESADATSRQLRRVAVFAVRSGAAKVRVAAAADISRPTLDAWIKEETE